MRVALRDGGLAQGCFAGRLNPGRRQCLRAFHLPAVEGVVANVRPAVEQLEAPDTVVHPERVELPVHVRVEEARHTQLVLNKARGVYMPGGRWRPVKRGAVAAISLFESSARSSKRTTRRWGGKTHRPEHWQVFCIVYTTCTPPLPGISNMPGSPASHHVVTLSTLVFTSVERGFNRIQQNWQRVSRGSLLYRGSCDPRTGSGARCTAASRT